MRPRVLVTQRLPTPVLARLNEICDSIVGTESGRLNHTELVAAVRDADGILCLLTDKINSEVIDSATRARIIANVAVGYNNIDVAAARKRNIVITNTPDVLTDATADLTWALILAVTRRVVEADGFLRSGRFAGWDFDLLLGTGLTGKTLGIVGYGRIGRAVARRAAGFGVNVLYCGRDEIAFRDDPLPGPSSRQHKASGSQPAISWSASARLDGLATRRVPFQSLLEQSDILTLHVPLATATKHLIDKAALARMKPSSYLINTSRGEIVDESAVVEMLESGRLGGAALDVFENEPSVHPALISMSNVVLLPHIGSATNETRTAMAMLAVENIIDHFSGRVPRNAI